MHASLVLVFATLAVGTGAADSDVVPGVVRYVDSQGEVHYTNDPAAVPEGSRAAPVRTAPLSEISHHTQPRTEMPRSGETPPLPPEARDAAPDPDLPSPEEEYWRGRFREANGRVAELEASLATDRELARQLEPFSVYSGRCNWSGGPAFGYPRGNCNSVNELLAVRERVREKEVALGQARNELEELERQASFRAVPREWRR